MEGYPWWGSDASTSLLFSAISNPGESMPRGSPLLRPWAGNWVLVGIVFIFPLSSTHTTNGISFLSLFNYISVMSASFGLAMHVGGLGNYNRL